MAMSKFEIPGAPPEVAERAKTMLGQSQTTEACMSEAEAKAGVRSMSNAMQQGDCTMEDFKQGGGTMSGVSPRTSRTKLNPTLASSIQLSRRIWNARMLMTLGREKGMVLAALR